MNRKKLYELNPHPLTQESLQRRPRETGLCIFSLGLRGGGFPWEREVSGI